MKLRAVVCAMVLILLIAGMGWAGGAAQRAAQPDRVVLKAGHGAQEGHATNIALLRFAELVAERSNGVIEVEVYPNMQLGQERELVEGLQLGTVDFAVVSTGPLGGFVPEVGVVDLPFLFASAEHAYSVLDGEIGMSVLDRFYDEDIIGVAFWENGWRHLTANRRVERPQDLRGLKVRTMENRVHMESFSAVGAAPIPMVWGEVYTSLQQGIIDAQENPVVVVYTNALWEVQDYYVLTGHFYGPHVFLASRQSIERLPQDLQDILLDTARELASFQRETNRELEEEQIVKLREQGMEVYELDNKQAFQEAMQPVYSQFESRFGKDLIQSILDAAH